MRDFLDPFNNFSNNEIMTSINKFELDILSSEDLNKVIDSNFENSIGFLEDSGKGFLCLKYI
jgi:hypothetical protein